VELTGELRALREAVRDLLRKHRPALDPAGPGCDPATTWRLLGEMGVAGLAVPERFGGAGAGPVEVSIVAEELGRALAPVPLLGSAVLATQAILAAGDQGACERLLPPLASGAATGALAWTDRDGRWDPAVAAFRAAARAGGGWTLSGTAHYVLDGDSAGIVIAAAALPDSDIGLFEVDPGQRGADRSLAPTMDQTRRLAVVGLDAAIGVPLSGAGADAAGHGAALAHARNLACVALAAEQAGAAAEALELTVGYSGQRVQFGRSIASFQAIQHRLAELHVLVESARSLAYRAASVAAEQAGHGHDGDSDGTRLPLMAAAAKAYCSQALAAVAAEMIQLHGAIGATWEHDAHRFFKRAHGSAQLFGAPSTHLARIAAAVIDD